jgi:UrcA family protein
MKTKTILLAAIAALSVSGIANAAPVEQSSVTVRLGDLNRASDAGRARAETRISNAAKAVCGGGYERDLRSITAFRNCATQARSTAIATLRTMSPTVEVAAR